MENVPQSMIAVLLFCLIPTKLVPSPQIFAVQAMTSPPVGLTGTPAGGLAKGQTLVAARQARISSPLFIGITVLAKLPIIFQ